MSPETFAAPAIRTVTPASSWPTVILVAAVVGFSVMQLSACSGGMPATQVSVRPANKRPSIFSFECIEGHMFCSGNDGDTVTTHTAMRSESVHEENKEQTQSGGRFDVDWPHIRSRSAGKFDY